MSARHFSVSCVLSSTLGGYRGTQSLRLEAAAEPEDTHERTVLKGGFLHTTGWDNISTVLLEQPSLPFVAKIPSQSESGNVYPSS